MSELKFVKIKAIEIEPHRYALWCSVGNGEPFANEICHRAWHQDGRIAFGLDSHNFWIVDPFEEVTVVELEEPLYRPTLCQTAAEFAVTNPSIVVGGAGI